MILPHPTTPAERKRHASLLRDSATRLALQGTSAQVGAWTIRPIAQNILDAADRLERPHRHKPKSVESSRVPACADPVAYYGSHQAALETLERHLAIQGHDMESSAVKRTQRAIAGLVRQLMLEAQAAE